jgi:hypothetical protein
MLYWESLSSSVANFWVFRLLVDFATWFSNKQAKGCIGYRLIPGHNYVASSANC